MVDGRMDGWIVPVQYRQPNHHKTMELIDFDGVVVYFVGVDGVYLIFVVIHPVPTQFAGVLLISITIQSPRNVPK